MNSIRQTGMIHHRHHTVHINILMAHECKSGVYYYGYYLICDLFGPVKVTDHGFFIINKYRTLPILMYSIYDLEVVLGAWGILAKDVVLQIRARFGRVCT